MIRIFILCIICISTLQCQNSKDKPSQLWLFTHYRSSNESSKIPATSFLWLGKNKNFTSDFGKFEFGTWQVQNEQLMLTSGGKTRSYKFAANAKEMWLSINNSTVINFESKPLKENDPNANPFSVNNNKWRIKAIQKETDTEVIARLINHCRFWEAWFTWALNNNLSGIDVRSTASPIKIYGNGFALKPLKELPRKWIDAFYDDQDCIKANAVLEKIIRTKNITWVQTDNRFKMFISAFQQLQTMLQESQLNP